MKSIVFAVFAVALLMFSCTGKKGGQGEEMPADSVADTTVVTETDTLELLITETPMPRAADAMFDDFIFNFVANKKLQKERIIFPLRKTENGKTELTEKDQWEMERFFMKQGYYTLFFDNDKEMELMKDTAVSEAGDSRENPTEKESCDGLPVPAYQGGMDAEGDPCDNA